MTGEDGRKSAEILRRFGSPLYVYDREVLRRSCALARELLPFDRAEVLYAMKANSNPAILAEIREAGFGVDAVSHGEVVLALRTGFPKERISYNGNNVTQEEMRSVAALGVHVCVDSLSQLERFGELGLGQSAAIRLNPDVGGGHHDHVITGGPDAKFGVAPSDLDEALAIARRRGIRIDGIQQHIGSGILDAERLLSAVDALLDAANRLPDLRYVDFGGGIGIPYRESDPEFDRRAFGAQLSARVEALRKRRGPIPVRIEPGRFIVAASGTLLVTVTAVKRTSRHLFVGTDSGFNHLLRPILYGAFHRIENLTNPDGREVVARIAGNICESGDLFAVDRPIPEPREGDILAIRDTGAYGFSMASTYNLRPRPAEVMIEGAEVREIRRRETLEDLLSGA